MTDMSEPQHAAYPDMAQAALSLELLISQLADADPTVRTWAAIGLRKRNDPRALPALFAMVNDSDLDVLEAVFAALDVLIPPDDLSNLFRLACMPASGATRRGSALHAYCLLQRNRTAAIDYLVSALADPDLAVRLRICSNLCDHIRWICRPNLVRDANDADISPGEEEQPYAKLLPALLRGLQDDSAVVRVACSKALNTKRSFRSKEVCFALLPLLFDIEESVRRAARNTLSRYRIALDDLQPYLHDECPEMRAIAIQLLPSKLTAEIAEELLTASRDTFASVRLAVAHYLGAHFRQLDISWSDERMLPHDLPLVQVFHGFLQDENQAVRTFVIKHFSDYWQHSLREKYFDALQYLDDDGTRIHAVQVLHDSEPRALYAYFTDIYAKAGIEGKIALLTLCARWDPLENRRFPRRIINSALEDADAGLRRAALEVMAQAKGTKLRPLLARFINDPVADVAAVATSAVQKIDEQLTYASLAAGLQATSSGKRYFTVSLLEDFTDPQRLSLLCVALHDTHAEVRHLATYFAQQYTDDLAILAELQRIARHDEDPEVRVMAIKALGRSGSLENTQILLPMLHEKSSVDSHASTTGFTNADRGILRGGRHSVQHGSQRSAHPFIVSSGGNHAQ